MNLRVISSGSIGNCYLFEAAASTLIVECGVSFSTIKQAINFDLNKICGAIVTHAHGDHARAVKDAAAAGINIYASAGTFDVLKLSNHRLKVIPKMTIQKIGDFEVIAFDVKHDCKEPLGFLIRHPEMGTTLFLTDTYYVPNIFKGLNNIIIEANYSDEIVENKFYNGKINPFVLDRVYKSHMSLKTCKSVLKANDLSAVNNIVLIHLSDGNSNAELFKKEIRELTGKTTYVAEKGLSVSLSKNPF